MQRIVFGVVVPASGSAELPARVDAMTRLVAAHAGIEIERRDASSYEALADDVRDGHVDVAWLPPIVFVRLADVVEPLGSIVRGGQSVYEAALVVRADSPIHTINGLRGSRAGWVDPWSAAGFVLPRVKLALLGVDPRTAFRTEKFHGTHRAAVEALVDGACDVIGTFARKGADGEVAVGAWSEVDGAQVRVIATFGAIPHDVIAVRSSVDASMREKLRDALHAAGKDEAARTVLREIFGGDELREGLAPGYDALRSALEMAAVRGLFD